MRKLRLFVVELVLVGILVAWIYEKAPRFIDRAIPWVVFAILWHLTWETLLEPMRVNKRAQSLCSRGGKMAWVVAFLIGGAISVGFLYSSRKFISAIRASSAPESSKERPSETPATKPETKLDSEHKPKPTANPPAQRLTNAHLQISRKLADFITSGGKVFQECTENPDAAEVKKSAENWRRPIIQYLENTGFPDYAARFANPQPINVPIPTNSKGVLMLSNSRLCAEISEQVRLLGEFSADIRNHSVQSTSETTPKEEVEKVAEETQRRQSITSGLHQEYILSHDGLTPAELVGTEVTQQEAEWINGRLREKGEIWKVAPTTKPSTPAAHIAIEPLKQRALLLANRVEIFSRERDTVWNGVYTQLKFGTLTEQDQKSNEEKRNKFAKDNRELFDRRFRKEASQMVEEFRTKGLDTTVAARALNPTIPNFFSIMEFVNALRGLAAQIDDNGKLIQ